MQPLLHVKDIIFLLHKKLILDLKKPNSPPPLGVLIYQNGGNLLEMFVLKQANHAKFLYHEDKQWDMKILKMVVHRKKI